MDGWDWVLASVLAGVTGLAGFTLGHHRGYEDARSQCIERSCVAENLEGWEYICDTPGGVPPPDEMLTTCRLQRELDPLPKADSWYVTDGAACWFGRTLTLGQMKAFEEKMAAHLRPPAIVGPWYWDRLITDDEIAALNDCVVGAVPKKPCIEVHVSSSWLRTSCGPICNIVDHLVTCGEECDGVCYDITSKAEQPSTGLYAPWEPVHNSSKSTEGE